MTHSYQSQTLSGFLDSMQQDEASAYSLFGPTSYPESVAFWHDPSAPAMAVAPSYTSKEASLLNPLDQKKHKRTRSGCFTCRARRIKCDETRPLCERCRKGSRECVYPSSTSSSKGSVRTTAKSRAGRPPSQGSDSSGKYEVEAISPLDPIIDEEEPDTAISESRPSPPATTRPDLHKSQSSQSLRKRSIKHTDAGSFIKEQSSSPSTESSRFESMSTRSGSIGHSTAEMISNARLPDDLRFYLNFHQEFLTTPHFFLRQSCSRFIQYSLIELALHLDSPSEITGLGEEHSEATLCTVLVLTTFEEYIGDWMNLIDHHRAAHALMLELLTPESANVNELHTNIFLWYARFDVVVGILAGTETVLNRDWYLLKEQYDADQAAIYPDEPSKQLALVASINRRFGLDMASLYAKLSRGMVSMEQFAAQNEQLGLMIEHAKAILRTFDDYEYKVQEFPHQLPLTEDDVTDPYAPGGLHRGPLWDFNYAWIDILSTETMYRYQAMLVLGQNQLPDLQELAEEQCRLIETMDRWPHKDNGYCIMFKNSIGIASMFLPKERKYQMWSRRKMALMEQNGYFITPRFRTALAAIWQTPEIEHWWLPNEEGYTDIIREIRALTAERLSQPRDELRENVRDMKYMFRGMNLDGREDESPSSTKSGHP
ncbi:hypothetical protein N7499_012957 [Penicillium canescens]|nr:hypothetical protein N7522_002427 [Penicillium canescens]KAJ6059746.1 hypothetical protein N7444_003385 [Penicillium canescens]KAJ6064277.1 hypothetical protein N7499_012957 [Penicillium canescens]